MEYVRTQLLPERGEWRDTNLVSVLHTKRENQRLAGAMAEQLSGPGWPEMTVPLNARCIPRRWKRLKLVAMGRTPEGDEILIPETAIPPGCIWQDGWWVEAQERAAVCAPMQRISKETATQKEAPWRPEEEVPF